MKKFIATLCLILLTCLIPSSAYAGTNLTENPGFENGSDRTGWSEYIWDKTDGISRIRVDNSVAHTGQASICIENIRPNDVRVLQRINVSGNRIYRLSCWIKADFAGADAKGANLSVEGLANTTKDLKSTAGRWEQVELYGITAKEQNSLVVTLGLGGYSSTNTGKAWFDDVTVEQVDTIPSGTEIIKFYREDLMEDATVKALKASYYNTYMLVYFVVFFLLFGFLSYYDRKTGRKITKTNETILLVAILASALLVRILLSEVIEGWPGDIATNKGWASAAAKSLTTFYSSVWCDYPPLLMYFFALVGKLASIPALAPHFTLLIKLPAILADIGTSFFLYKVASRQLKPRTSLIVAAAYAFHPAVFMDSTIWGQVDSLFTLIIIAALVFLVERKFEVSAVLMTAATLMKPQGIFFLPVMLFELIKRRKASKFLTVILCGLATTIVIILPFAIHQEPLWIFKLYLSTGAEYPFASMNPFNIFTLAGGNFVDGATKMFHLSFNTWGLIFDGIVLALAGYIHLKSRHTAAPIVVAAVLNAGAFIFSVKMHERYLFPVVAILLLAAVYLKDRKIVLIFAGFSATAFFNIHLLFYRMLKFGVTGSYFSANAPDVIIFSLMNILLFVALVRVSRDLLIDPLPRAAQSRQKGVRMR